MSQRAESDLPHDDSFRHAVEGWSGSHVAMRYDSPSGAWMFVAMHDTALGTPTGGCRMRVYPTPTDGLEDALRLAEGMTYKWAAVEFAFGGGKSVIAVPEIPAGREREALFRRFGRFLEDLQGAYFSGEDLGTTPEDMAVVAEETGNIMGVVGGESPEPVDPGPYTARGVLSAMQAGLSHVYGSPALEGRRVLVQGVGDVGDPLAWMISDEGGIPILADPDTDRMDGLRQRLEQAGRNVEVTAADTAFDQDVDVFAPCAVGGVLDQETVARLRCRLVSGSANNQLAQDQQAHELLARGITYVPDFLANAGGAIAFGMILDGAQDAGIRKRVEAIGDTVAAVLQEADTQEESPLASARRRAERVLEEARRASEPTPRRS